MGRGREEVVGEVGLGVEEDEVLVDDEGAEEDKVLVDGGGAEVDLRGDVVDLNRCARKICTRHISWTVGVRERYEGGRQWPRPRLVKVV